ncbi:MAG: CHAT domain-containing protein [Symploca sp. SIO2E9]|nr:CHAT domain-containing protein [Symploca sp. SIO2E9]
MKYLFELIAIAILGIFLSLGIHTLTQANTSSEVQTQVSGLALIQAGKQHYDAGQFSEASQLLHQAAEVYEARGDVPRQAQAMSLISLAQQKLGQWQQAEAAIQASESLLHTQPTVGAKIHAQVLNSQGHLQLAMGKADSALETWQAAAKLYADAQDFVGVIGSQINQAQAMQSLGLYRRAEQLLTQIEEKLKAQPDSHLKATGLRNLGNLRRRLGDLEYSHQLLEQSLAIAQQLDLLPDESKAFLGLGNSSLVLAKRAQVLGNVQQTKQYTQKALAYYQNASATATSAISRTQAQLNQLSLLIEDSQYKSALALSPQIQQLLAEVPQSRASVYAQVNLAQSLIKIEVSKFGSREEFPHSNQGWYNKLSHPASTSLSLISNPQEITQILENALAQAYTLEDLRAQSYALGTMGKFYENTKDWSKAKDFTQSAMLIAQKIKAADIAYQWQWQMGRILQIQAQQETNSQDTDAEALRYYIAAKDILNDLRSDLIALNPEVQFSFRENVEPVYRQLVDLLLRSNSPSQDNLTQALEVIENLQLAELDNFFRDACASPEEVRIDDLDQESAVIYPIILADRLEVILKLPGNKQLLHYTNHNLFENQVDQTVQKFRKILNKRSTSLREIKTQSQQFYNWLIKPFAEELEQNQEREVSPIKTLVFVLDGSLRNVPIASLYDGKHYLVERYAVALTPGLQLLDPKPITRETTRVLVAGATDAPSFQEEGLGPINNVEVELSGVVKQVEQSQTLENQDFLQENLKQQINSAPFNVIHIATHGKFSSNPEQTFILDWDSRIKVKDFDNLLRLSNPLNLPIQLLILSACETATGDKRAALGLAGIAIRAGARSTLATLWNVDDLSTAEFMIEFYKQLNNSQLTKAEALRKVQLSFLTQYQGTDYHRPYHWAPFVLVGNWL